MSVYTWCPFGGTRNMYPTSYAASKVQVLNSRASPSRIPNPHILQVSEWLQLLGLPAVASLHVLIGIDLFFDAFMSRHFLKWGSPFTHNSRILESLSSEPQARYRYRCLGGFFIASPPTKNCRQNLQNAFPVATVGSSAQKPQEGARSLILVMRRSQAAPNNPTEPER